MPMYQFWIQLDWVARQPFVLLAHIAFQKLHCSNPSKVFFSFQEVTVPQLHWFIDDFNKILPEKSPILEDPSLRASFSLLSEELKAGKQRHRAERKVQLYSQLQRKWLGASKWQLKQNLHVNRFLAVFFYMVMIWIYYLSADSMFSHSKAPTEDASTKSLQSRQQKLPELLSLDCSSLWWLLRAVFQISTSVLCGWKDWTIL